MAPVQPLEGWPVMARYSRGGTKILTESTRVVPGGMADPGRTRFDHLMTAGRPVWADDPALDLPCQQPDVDPDWWFANGTGKNHRVARGFARMFCGGCPMQAACNAHGRFLRASSVSGVHGVWGGELMEPLTRPGTSQRKGAAS
jgi:hypothetical protein